MIKVLKERIYNLIAAVLFMIAYSLLIVITPFLLLFSFIEKNIRDDKKIRETSFVYCSLRMIAYVMSKHGKYNPQEIQSVLDFIAKIDPKNQKERHDELKNYLENRNDYKFDEIIRIINSSLDVSYRKKLDLLRCVSMIRDSSGNIELNVVDKIASGLNINKNDAKNVFRETIPERQGSSKNCEEGARIRDFVYFSLAMMVKVMHIDWSNKVAELDVIKCFIWTWDRKNFKEWMPKLKGMINTMEYKIDVDATVKWIKENFDENQIFDLIYNLYDIAYADGQCTYEEAEFLKKVIPDLLSRESSAYDQQTEIYNVLKNERLRFRNRYRSEWTNKSDGNDGFENTKSKYEEKTKSQTSSSQPKISAELQKAYAVLNIPVDATDSELRACRRNFMRINHPDLFANRGAEAVEKATLKCQDFNKAFDIVKKSRGM